MRLSPKQAELYREVNQSPNRILVRRVFNQREADIAGRLAKKLKGVFHYTLCGGAVFYLGCGMTSEVCQRLIRESRQS